MTTPSESKKTAEEIANDFCDKFPGMASSARWLNLVNLLNAFADAIRESYAKGAAEMREKTIKIVEMWPGDGGCMAVNDPTSPTDCMNSLRKGIVQAIRALPTEGK